MDPLSDMERKFQQMVLSFDQKVQCYKDKRFQKEALQLIPVDALTIRATQKLSKLEAGNEDIVSLDDLLLMELMLWFKNEFFSWMDPPTCLNCGQQTVTDPSCDLKPTEEESKWHAHTVEGFRCPNCSLMVRFPRYNHPSKLLSTRKGRCGEWANCFALIVHAIGREARIVYDFADHVWNEVYSPDRGEWLHVDPCESAFDTPLLYEKGWKKKVTFVVAFSPWDINDVTWRYTTDFSAAIESRKNSMCREEFVEHVISQKNEKLLSNLPQKEREERQDRMFNELMQFLTPKADDGTSYGGRTSGSLVWRLARGETGGLVQDGYVFQLCPLEVEQKLFHLRYSCAKNIYFRTGMKDIEGWDNCMFEHNNIFRKLEMDWKQVYLCRTEGEETGFLEWKFDFQQSGLVIDEVTLTLHSVTFENGNVTTWVWPGLEKNCPGVTVDEGNSSLSQYLRGQCGFSLKVDLSGGKGEVSWQHAQLFRQGMNDFQMFPLDLKVTFSSKSTVTYRYSHAKETDLLCRKFHIQDDRQTWRVWRNNILQSLALWRDLILPSLATILHMEPEAKQIRLFGMEVTICSMALETLAILEATDMGLKEWLLNSNTI